ncbi:MAG: MATE family efflux transporter [Clostridiales bacterium]|nr:MATE family efflux transporter [Clostridiales bacterium]
MHHAHKTTARDMTRGSIVQQIILFSLPLMLGNIFQMLYNTVDMWVVGNYVSTQAQAAIGSTQMITNMAVFFFNGFSIGAGVLIGQRFGARDMDRLHDAIETTMAATFVFCIVFTALGALGARPMLRFMSTPDDVIADSTQYLTIYFAGISGLLIYNMGSGILRAVGDTTRPLVFLIITSVLNIVLDLAFVLWLHAGIAGVAYATILSQFISAILTLMLLTRTKDIYRLVWRDLRIDPHVLRRIFAVGLPAGIQSVITAFSNVFVQSYINFFGSACMAGWSCYNKLDSFIMLPMQSMAMAATTFVSQNIGANQKERADRGTLTSILLSVGVTFAVAVVLVLNAPKAVEIFNKDPAVIEYGAMFMRANTFFLLFNCVNHVLAGALRGRGDSKGPMIIMLAAFVGIRQVYLFTVTRFFANTALLVGLGYPVGWTCCFIIETAYALRKRRAESHI